MGESLTVHEIVDRVNNYYQKHPSTLREISSSLRYMKDFEYDDTIWTRIKNSHPKSLKATILDEIEIGQLVTRAELARRYQKHISAVGQVLVKREHFKHVGFDGCAKVYKRV